MPNNCINTCAACTKGAQQLAPDRAHHFTCSYLYGAVCLSLIIFFVMVISPMPGMDYHKFQQPVHAPHPGLHTSVATPLLMITGSFPQVFSIILSLHQIERISGNSLCCKSGSSSSRHELSKINSNVFDRNNLILPKSFFNAEKNLFTLNLPWRLDFALNAISDLLFTQLRSFWQSSKKFNLLAKIPVETNQFLRSMKIYFPNLRQQHEVKKNRLSLKKYPLFVKYVVLKRSF